MKVRFRHKIAFAVLRPIFSFYLKRKYRYRAVKFNDSNLKKKPFLILSNHTTAKDPFLISLSFKRPVYFVANDAMFPKKFSALIKFLISPIVIKPGFDINSVKEDCAKVAQQNGAVCVFPENGRTFYGETGYIDKTIVQLVRKLDVTLVLYNINGGYGANPVWSGNVRRGKVIGKVVKVLNSIDYSKLTDNELYNLICDNLYVNDVKDNNIKFKANERAQFLERVCYLCPDCQTVSSFKSEKNMFRCSNCRAACIYHEDLSLQFIKGYKRFTTVKEWYDYQLDCLKKTEIDLNGTGKVYLSDNEIKFEIAGENKNKILQHGKLNLFCDRLEIESQFEKDTFLFSDIKSVAVTDNNKLEFCTKENAYRISKDLRFCAIKYCQYIEEFKKKPKNAKKQTKQKQAI